MEEIVKKDSEKVENLIYEIRGQQVMLDSDLARLYRCKNGTKTINLAVKRHKNRFPERFMFRLTREEYYKTLRFQFETLELEQGKYSKFLPYVFTEQGVAMLATIIKTEVAEEMSVRIMDAFVAMKKYISSGLLEQKYVNKLVFEDHDRIDLLESSFKKFEEKRQDNAIFFNGQIYDAYSKIYEIFREAKKNLAIVDGYADITILNIVKKLNVRVVVITSDRAPLSVKDVEKYNKQYNNLRVVRDNTFHDRYFILDNETVYHCGASVNYAGYKTFSIVRLNDKGIIGPLKRRVAEVCRDL